MIIRKELWFGFGLMALIVVTVLVLTPWSNLFDAHLDKADLGVLGLLMGQPPCNLGGKPGTPSNLPA